MSYGHDNPPPGYARCTREAGHPGPCAHPFDGSDPRMLTEHDHHWQLLTHTREGDSHDWYFTCGCCAVLHVYEYTPKGVRACRYETLHEPMSWGAANAHGRADAMRWAVGMACVAWAYAMREYATEVQLRIDRSWGK